MKFLILTACLSLLMPRAFCQPDSPVSGPVVGKPCPDFKLTEINYWNKKQATLHDFAGKWLVLDFWSRWCVGCIRSFPKTNRLQAKFKDKVNFMLVGLSDSLIRPMYQHFRQRDSLTLSVAFDSVIFKNWDLGPVPYIVVIDDRGVVRAIAGELGEEQLAALLKGEHPLLEPGWTRSQQSDNFAAFNFQKPLLVDGNGGADTDFLYRSVLRQWRPGQTAGQNPYIDHRRGNMVQYPGSMLSFLYLDAYGDTIPPWPIFKHNSYGKWVYLPILEMTDSSQFAYDNVTGKNIFGYSLIVPKRFAGNTVYLQHCMQRDLQNYFGYRVTVEERERPIWKLVARPDAARKLGSHQKSKTMQALPDKFICHACHFSDFVNELWHYNQNGNSIPPFIDSTGIDIPIDITITTILSDLQAVRRQLSKYGIDMILSTKTMKAVVIHDKIDQP